MNKRTSRQLGFSLIELLVASTIFSFVVAGVSGLFLQALDLQRRASGIQKIQENALYVMESLSREVRVSKITSPNTVDGSGACDPTVAATRTITLDHPVNGNVTYVYDRSSGFGVIKRNGEQITSADVDILSFGFCVSGAGADLGKQQSRVTIPMTIQSLIGRGSARVSVSLQTTIISRDISQDLAP